MSNKSWFGHPYRHALASRGIINASEGEYVYVGGRDSPRFRSFTRGGKMTKLYSLCKMFKVILSEKAITLNLNPSYLNSTIYYFRANFTKSAYFSDFYQENFSEGGWVAPPTFTLNSQEYEVLKYDKTTRLAK